MIVTLNYAHYYISCRQLLEVVARDGKTAGDTHSLTVCGGYVVLIGIK